MKINILKTELRDIEELTPFQGELKTLSKADAKKLRKQIEEHGFIDPFIVWEHNGKTLILGGHQRQVVLYQMRADGETVPKLPCNFIECADEKQAKQIVLALTSQFGEITEKGLIDFSSSFDFTIPDLKANFRFPDVDLTIVENKQKAAAAKDAEPQVNLAEELNKKWQVRPGDLFQIGEHRLLCGDSTKREDVERVIGGDKYSLLLTDPPYGVSYAAKNAFLNAIAKGNAVQERILGDHQTPEEMSAFWVLAFTTIRALAADGASYYVTGPQGGDLLLLLLLALRDSGFPLRHMLIWAKNNMVLGRCDYHYKHEPIIFGWIDGAGHKFYGGRGENSLWEIDKPHESKLHPTMKPVELFMRAVNNSSEPDGIIFDPFLGSGTTMVAAQNLTRKCRGIEISPDYCAVILQRMTDAFPGIKIEKSPQ